MKTFFLTLLGCATCSIATAAVNVLSVTGWMEAGAVTFTPYASATDYHVYVTSAQSNDFTLLDAPLVRNYGSYLRADAVGLKAGDYQFRVVPVVDNAELTSEATLTATFTATAHDRAGFAHSTGLAALGAYNHDGTLRDGARVVYVHRGNAKSIAVDVITTAKGGTTTSQGLQDLIYLYQKGYDTTPLDIRIIGTLSAADMDRFDSSEEGLQIKGKNEYSEMPITIEGIGCDATLHGFGVLVRNCQGVEIRNIAVMYAMDDCLSLDTGNCNVWIHHNDFFYGQPGSDSDQAKGDGTVDIKGESRFITVSYNHFYDSGKSSLGGMKSETTACHLTYHHNWFDHSDSRHPRVRTMFFHIYNNYYDGNSKYGVGMTSGGSAFVEQNYFRNCKYPMLTSKQGSDAEGTGTFSGENGGIIKAYQNTIKGARKVQYYDGSQTDGRWDAVLVNARDEEVTATAYSGGSSYNAEADLEARTKYIENHIDAADDVPDIVKGSLGAGRMQHGDFTWLFNNSLQDENYAVISELSTAIKNYKPTLVGLADGTVINTDVAAEPFTGGDGVGIDAAENDAYVPSWMSGGGSGVILPTTVGNLVLGTTDDYFWFNEENSTKVDALIADGTITGGTFVPTHTVVSSDGTVYSDYTGSIRVAKSGTLTFYLPNGISRLDLYTSGNGSMSWQLQTSTDGTTFSDLGSAITGSKGTHPSVIASPSMAVPYIRVVNNGGGNRDVQGVRLYAASEQEEAITVLTETAKQTTTYDLQGRPNHETSGLYIVNNKAILIMR